MSNLIATKRVDLLAPYLALDQGPKVMAECELLSTSLSPLGGGWVCEQGIGIVEVRGGVYAVSGYDDSDGDGMEDYGHPASSISLVVHLSVLRQLPHPHVLSAQSPPSTTSFNITSFPPHSSPIPIHEQS